MTKNVAVFDSEGKMIGMTYPKRAMGLVKNGRARWSAGSDAAIILASSPETVYTSQEDEIMSNYNNEELRARIDELIRETKEKIEAVCRTAADTIEDFVERIDDSDDVTVEVNEDGDTILHMEEEPEGPAENGTRGRFIRMSDEDMEKLRAMMSNLRESFGRVTEEVKVVAVKTGAEIGRYAEAVKAKVTEKLAEREAEAEASRPGSEAYYLEKIAEIQADKAYVEDALNRISELRSQGVGDVATPGIAEAINGTVCAQAEINRKLLEFYIEQLKLIQSKSNEAAEQARLDAERKSETPVERRARLVANDATIQMILKEAASNRTAPGEALSMVPPVIEHYIKTVYGDFDAE